MKVLKKLITLLIALIMFGITGCNNNPVVVNSKATNEDDSGSVDGIAWNITGSTFTHDPTMIYAEGKYHMYYTAGNIGHKVSDDGKYWKAARSVFTSSTIPSFVNENNCVCNNGVFEFWAPDITKIGDTYYMYYNISIFGKRDSTIALLKSSDLNTWEEVGQVISSTQAGSVYNCIDANFVIDNDNRYWLSFGSFSDGIYMVEIDPSTMLTKSGATPFKIAKKSQMEAPFIWNPGNGYYYLITSVGLCCKGVESTYKIEYGRSQNISGPYLDKNGTDLKDGGGSILLKGAGKMIGPGGQCVIKDKDGKNVLVHHYYDRDNNGVATLSVRDLSITSTNWLAAGTNADSAAEVNWDVSEAGKVSSAGAVKAATIPALSVNADTGYYVEFTFNESITSGMDWSTFVLSYLGYKITIPNLDPYNNTDTDGEELKNMNAYPGNGGILEDSYAYDFAYKGSDVKIKITLKKNEGIKYYADGVLACSYPNTVWDGKIQNFIQAFATGISTGKCVFNSAQYNMKDITIGVLN